MATLKQLIECEISDFFAGFGHPGEPETPEEMQSQLLARVMPLLAGLEQEPVAYIDPFTFKNFATFRAGETDNKRMGREWVWANPDAGLIPLYAAPQLPQPAVEALKRLRSIVADPKTLPRRKEWISGQQYSYVLLESVEAMVDDACRAAMLQGAEPVTTAYKLRDGWVAVPVEPTAAMYEAGDLQLATKQVWDAMIAAAPQQEADNG